MRLADFIVSNIEPILVEWETFARGTAPGALMDSLALRDHAREILLATVADMQSSQNVAQRSRKSKGFSLAGVAGDALDDASESHAIGRLGSGFNLLEVVSEYRALRASVLQLWSNSNPAPEHRNLDDLTRFNESIDQSLAESVSSYTHRVDQSRDLFLAILSHDLRNPLNSISMSAGLIARPELPASDRHACALQIATNVGVMARMIRDLLDYTRTRLGAGMPVSPVPMDLAPLCRELFNEYRTAHPDRAMHFQTEGTLTGTWDADRLRQAVSNLLGNAIQHGDANTLILFQVTADPANVVLIVRSGGPHIPAGELQRIFDPLIRGSGADRPQANRPGSIGLGLYIAREIARSHGGRIDVSSSDDAGTAFTIRLPRKGMGPSGPPILDEQHVTMM